MTEREEIIDMVERMRDEKLSDAIIKLEEFFDPNDESVAALDEGLRLAKDPNVKLYTVEEAFEEFSKW